jgi:hypothetical protein
MKTHLVNGVPCHCQWLHQRAHVQAHVLRQLEHIPGIHADSITHAATATAQPDEACGIAAIYVSLGARIAVREAREGRLNSDFVTWLEEVGTRK